MCKRSYHLIGLLMWLGTLCLQAGTVFAGAGKVLRLSPDPQHTGAAPHAIGGGGGSEFQQMCPPGMVVVGMGAHSGAEVNRIGYLLCKPFQSAQIESEYATMVMKEDLINKWASFAAVKVEVNAGGGGGALHEYVATPGNAVIGFYGQIRAGLSMQVRSVQELSHPQQVCESSEAYCKNPGTGGTGDEYGQTTIASPWHAADDIKPLGLWGTANESEFPLGPSVTTSCDAGRVMTGIRGQSDGLVNQIQPICTFIELVDSQGCEVWGYDALTSAGPSGAYYPIILNAPKNDYDELESPQKNWDLIQKAVLLGYCNVGDAEVVVRLHGRHVFTIDQPVVLTAPDKKRLIYETVAFEGYTDFEPSDGFNSGIDTCAVTLNGNVTLRQSDFLKQPYWIDGALHGQLIPFFSGYHSFGVSGFPVSSVCLMHDNNIFHMGWVEQGCGKAPEGAVRVQGNNNRIADSRITQNCGHGIVVQSGQGNQIVRTSWDHMLDVDTTTFVKGYTPEGMQPLQTGIPAPKIALTIPDKTKPHLYRMTASQLPPATTKLELYLGAALWDAKFQPITLKYDATTKTYSPGALPGVTVPHYLDFEYPQQSTNNVYQGPAPYNLRHGCIDLSQGNNIDLDLDALGITPGRQLFVTAHTVQLSAEQKKVGKTVCDPDLALNLEAKGHTSTFSAPVYFSYDADNNGKVDGACEGIGAGMGCVDTDTDGVVDTADNCPAKVNATQGDDDGDGIGNLCDASACPAGQTLDPAADQCKDLGCEHGAPRADGTCPEAPPPPKCAAPLTEKADGTCCDPDAPTDQPISCGYVPTEAHTCADPAKEQWDFTTGACVPIPGTPATCAAGEDPDPTDPTQCIATPKENPTKGSGEDCAKLGQVFDANTQQCVDAAAPPGENTTNTAVTADTSDVTNGGGTPAASTEEKKEEPKCESGLFINCGQNAPQKEGWIHGCSLVRTGTTVPGRGDYLLIGLMTLSIGGLIGLRRGVKEDGPDTTPRWGAPLSYDVPL